MKNLFLKRLIALGFLLTSATSFAQTNVFDDVIAASPAHTHLTAALEATGLDDAIRNDEAEFTVFAPDDNAIEALAEALDLSTAELLELEELPDLILYHVLGSTVLSGDIINGDIVTPLNAANTLKLTATSGGSIFVNQAQVNGADLTADNGVVHSVDGFLLPSETVADVAIDNGFGSLVAAVVTAELLPALTNPFADFTVFAPSDAAFDDLAAALGTDISGLLADPGLADILLYHVLDGAVMSSMINNGDIVTPLNDANTIKLTATSGGSIFANQAEVFLADVGADNGIVHAVNAVILPSETVADVAIDNGFGSLVAAVVTAELLPALTNPFADFTVFAPSDAAFDDLAAALGTDISGLLADPGLADILLYHVLDGAVMSSMINNGDIVTPLNDVNTIKLTKIFGDIFVNQAQVELQNVLADNGVVHAIDAVILPSETVADVAIDNEFNALTAAVIKARLLPALTDPFADYTVFAPSDEAFLALANALGTNVQGILNDPDLVNILLYHVLDGSVMSTMINNGDIVTPLNDANTLKLTATAGGDIFVNQSQVFLADVGAENGVVHAIDGVLLSAETVADVAIDNGFTALTAAIVTAELLPALVDPFSRYTVFAPTDDAFIALAEALDTDIEGLLALPNLADILLYHVVGEELFSTELVEGPLTMLNGQNTFIDLSAGVQINNATVVGADNPSDNGVLHIINEVIDFNFFICEPGIFQTPTDFEVVQSQFDEELSFQWTPVPGSVACQVRVRGSIQGTIENILVQAGEDGNPPSQILLSQSDFSSNEIYQAAVRCACSIDPIIASDFSQRVFFVAFGGAGINVEEGTLVAEGDFSMSVFPNPSSAGYINVNISNSAGVHSEGLIEVFDITGRIVNTERVIVEAQQQLQIETSNMPAGMYSISYTTNQTRITERFMVK